MLKVLLVALPAVVLLSACTSNTVSSSPSPESDAMMEASPSTEAMASDSMMASPAMEEKGVMVGGAMMVQSKDIVDNAMMSKDHTTLVAAVKAAGLVETLKGEGPFTVFAPTNAAFEKLPKGTVEGLLKPEKKADLTKVLTYHVVPGRYMAKDVTNGLKLKTVQGQELSFSVVSGKVMLNGTSTVTIADVVSSNGITHVVDTVLMPK